MVDVLVRDGKCGVVLYDLLGLVCIVLFDSVFVGGLSGRRFFI